MNMPAARRGAEPATRTKVISGVEVGCRSNKLIHIFDGSYVKNENPDTGENDGLIRVR